MIWQIIHYFHFSNQKTLRYANLYVTDYDNYPEQLRNNFLIKNLHDEREKWADNLRKQGHKVAEDYYQFKFLEKEAFKLSESDWAMGQYIFTSKYGNLEIRYQIYSLLAQDSIISNLLNEKVDFRSRDIHAYNIDIKLVVIFSKLSSLYMHFDRYIEWLNDFIEHFLEFDWNRYLENKTTELILRQR